MNKNPLLGLETFGQSAWLDVLRRNARENGVIQRLINQDRVSGLTSNPSIFEKAIAGSHDDDNAIRAMALEGKSIEEMYEALTIEDIQRVGCVHLGSDINRGLIVLKQALKTALQPEQVMP